MSVSQELIEQLPVEWCGIDDVQLDPANPNKMSHSKMEGLRQVMKQWGDGGPVRVDANMIMIDGEHRWRILKSDGTQKIQYIKHPKVTTAGERAQLRQYYNQLHGEHEKYLDDLELKRIFEDGKLEEFARNMAEDEDLFRRRLKAQFAIEFGGIETSIVSLPSKTNIRRGQVFKLGRHSLMCGDCRVQLDVSNLLQEARVDSLQTDPPYGVDYSAKNAFLNSQDKGNRMQDPIVGDDIKDLKTYLVDAWNQIPWAEYNTFYVWMAGNKSKELIQSFEESKMTFSQELVWLKNNHVLSRLDHQQKHELCFYGWYGKHHWKGGASTMSVYLHDKPLVNDLHPTMKPVAVIEEFIRESTKENDIIYDPFAGSGTTMIASEKAGRTCYSMEIDPIYCQAIIDRFEAYAGVKAVGI